MLKAKHLPLTDDKINALPIEKNQKSITDPTIPPVGTRPTHFTSIASVGFRSIKNNAQKKLFEQNLKLKFEPANLLFNEYQPDTEYEGQVKILNCSKKSKQLYLMTPKSKHFTLKNGTPLSALNIAPGMSHTVTVLFKSPKSQSEQTKLTDILNVSISGGFPLVVPLDASPFSTRLVYDEILDFGPIILDTDEGKKSIKIKSLTSSKSHFKCVFDSSLPIRVEPMEFTLNNENKEINLIVYIKPKSEGQFTAQLELKVDSPITLPKITLNANVLKHRLCIIVNEKSFIDEAKIDFGTVFFGQEVVFPVRVENRGSTPVHWIITSSNQSIPYCSDHGSLPQKQRRKLMDEEYLKRINMFVDPIEGTISPQDSKIVNFKFKPLSPKQYYGFKNNANPPELSSFQQQMKLQLTKASNLVDLSTDAPIDILLTGKGSPILAHLDSLVKFEDGCKIKQIKLRNDNSDLSFDFKFKKISHFTFSPSSGTVNPNEFVEITIEFKPNQIGNFCLDIHCHLSMPTLGKSGLLISKQIIGTKTFRIEAKYSSKEALEHSKGAVLTKYPNNVKLPTINGIVNVKSIFPHSSHSLEWDQKVKNRNIYISYIRSERVKFLRSTYNSKCDPIDEYNSRIPLIDSSTGLLPPEPVKIQRYTKQPKNSIVDIFKNSSSLAISNPESRIEKILSPSELEQIYVSSPVVDFGSISTHSTKKLPLSFLNNISAGTPVHLELSTERTDGKTLLSIEPKSFLIHSLNVGKFEVSFCRHEPGIFQAELIYCINNRHTYRIPLKANVVYMPIKCSIPQIVFVGKAIDFGNLSEADSASESHITKYVGTTKYCIPRFEQDFDLINEGGCEVGFKIVQDETKSQDLIFQGPFDSGFVIEPNEGIIAPNKKVKIVVKYVPGVRYSFEANMNIEFYDFKVQNRIIQNLTIGCKSAGPESQCSLVNVSQRSSIDFGILPINVHHDNSIHDPKLTPFGINYDGRTPLLGKKIVTVKNSGNSACNYVAFFVRGEDKLYIENPYGTIPANGSIDIRIFAETREEGIYEDQLYVNIIGGNKSFKIPIKLEAREPKISIEEEDSVKFRELVIVGSSTSQKYLLNNIGSTFARAVVELTNANEFSLNSCKLIESDKNAASPKSTIDRVNQPPRYSIIPGEENTQKLLIDILPGESISLEILYAPKDTGSCNSPFRVYLAGIEKVFGYLNHKTKGIPSPIHIKTSNVIFDDIYISLAGDKQAQTAEKSVPIKNVGESPLDWSLEMNQFLDQVFTIDPLNGTLLPGESQLLKFKFAPTQPQRYSNTGSLILSSQSKDKIKFEINVSGACLIPSISFDPPEVFLPITPKGQTSSIAFSIINHGCELGEINAVISPELKKDNVSLQVIFPEGSVLRGKNEKLPCLVKFTYNEVKSDEAISFTTRVQFCGVLQTSAYLTIHGSSDSCALTLQPYFFRTRNLGKYKIDGNEIEYDHSEEFNLRNILSNPLRTPAGIPIRSAKEVEDADKFWTFTGETILRWLGDHAAFDVKAFPSCITGRAIVDLLQSLLSKKIPGISAYVATAYTQEERIKHSYRLYNSVILYLCSIGALLSSVKPEFLLSPEDSKAFREQNRDKSPISLLETEINLKYDIFLDKYSDLISKEAWAIVLLQIVRVFIMPVTKQGQNLQIAQVFKFSNVYSPGQLFLLNWCSDNFKMNSKLSDFCTGFQDSMIISHLLHKYTGTSIILETKGKNEAAKQLVSNLADIYDSGYISTLDYKDIVHGTQLEFMMLILFLYQTLPSFLPKSTLEMETCLHQPIQKSIDLVNMTNRVINYTATLRGDPSFALVESQITAPAKGQAQLKIDFKSGFARVSSASVILRSKRIGFNISSILVYKLVCSVENSGPIKILELSSPLYAPTTVPIFVTNPFNVDANFTVNLNEKVGGKNESASSGSIQLDSLPLKCYSISETSVSIKAASIMEIQLRFVPFFLGTHVCNVTFVDSMVGEFTYKVVGECTEPLPIDTVIWTTNSDTPIQKVLRIPGNNSMREKAISIASTLMPSKSFGSKNPKKETNALAQIEKEIHQLPKRPLRYKVESSSNCFKCPAEVTLKPLLEHKNTVGMDNGLNNIPITFTPLGPGKHVGKIKLTCLETFDIRTYAIHGIVRSGATSAELEFVAGLKEKTIQELPISNNSGEDCNYKVNIQGTYFTCTNTFVAKAKSKSYIPVIFQPLAVGEYVGSLSFTNMTTNQRYSYKLIGKVGDPTQDGVIAIEATVKEKIKRAIPIQNDTDKEVIYEVTCDAMFSFGEPQIKVAPFSKSDYMLLLHPRLSGNFSNVIKFASQSDKSVLWYNLELKILKGAPEQNISVETAIKNEKTVEIEILNHSTKYAEYQVQIQAPVTGKSTISLAPKSKTVYAMRYNPTLVEDVKGSITFVNNDIGEFWYSISCKSHE